MSKDIVNSCIGFGIIIKNQFNKYQVISNKILSNFETNSFIKCIEALEKDNSLIIGVDFGCEVFDSKDESLEYMCKYSPQNETVMRKADSCKKLYYKFIDTTDNKEAYYIFNYPEISDDLNLICNLHKILTSSSLGKAVFKNIH